MEFNLVKKDSTTHARRGELHLAHGVVQTPAFMPVGTVGSVKAVSSEELLALGAEIILGNAYHLNLRPTSEYIKEQFGSLHQFMNWQKPILTDSGGFQVFSLGLKAEVREEEDQPRLVKIDDEGVLFQSHIDGSKHFFTPERVIDIQRNLGSDIMMPLDVCTEFPATYERARETMEQTHRWEKRGIEYWETIKRRDEEISSTRSPGGTRALADGLVNPSSQRLESRGESGKERGQAYFGIVQGGTYGDLRAESAHYISSLGFDGIAIGGVSVGEGKEAMQQAVRWAIQHIPETKPRYLMGVGEPEDMIRAVAQGIDMFDCVLPTRLGRHGVAWIGNEASGFMSLHLIRTIFRTDTTVIEPGCTCPACKSGYSRAYVHHLLKEREILGVRLVTLHNLHHVLHLFGQIRNSIADGTFSEQYQNSIGKAI